MSTPRTVSKEDVLAAEANPQLQRLVDVSGDVANGVR
jgi:hypothetical protein